MGGDVIDEGGDAVAEAGLRDDGVDEPHEYLRRVLVAERHPPILEEAEAANKGGLLGGCRREWYLPEP